MNTKQKILIGLLILSAIALPAAMAYADSSGQLVNLNFPCPSSFAISGISGGCAQLSSSISIGGFLNTFYQIALGLSGLLALVMIIYGGIEYSLSAGNVGSQEDARDVILSAIYGLVLLFASYLILNTINPQITSLYTPGQAPGENFQPAPTASSQTKTPINTECVVSADSKTPVTSTSTYGGSPTSMIAPLTYLGTNNNFDNDSQANCNDRTFNTGKKIEITGGDYYGSGYNIIPGSKIWQYPYFPGADTSTQAIANDARCLIYAYQEPYASSDITMVKLVPTLQLCAFHNQIFTAAASGDTAYCKPNAPCGCSTSRCSDINGQLAYKGPGVACTGDTCYLDNNLISTLEKVYAKTNGGWQVSEAWPPTVVHQSTCHNLGTCADIVLVPQLTTDAPADCKKVTDIISTLKDYFPIVLNEYSSKCGGISYDTTTGWNIHVEETKIITGQNY